jgi:pimeloyl-ACP methyl ester carboxylesterase
MARRLTAQGFVALRFDLSGLGDSTVRKDHLPFAQSAVSETREAMDYLAGARGCERFVLAGICSGAGVSLRTACSDPRVVGAALINARNHLHERSDEALSASIANRTQTHHWWRLAFSSSFKDKNWLRAITGKVDYARVLGDLLRFPIEILFRRRGKGMPKSNPFVAELRNLCERGVDVLHVYSEGDEGLDYLHVVLGKEKQALEEQGLLKLEVIPATNHSFSLLWSQERLSSLVVDWLQAVAQH